MKETTTVAREKLVSLATQFFNGHEHMPDPNNSHPPGPWDPVIHKALGRMWVSIYGPLPDPWVTITGPFPQPWGNPLPLIALNPPQLSLAFRFSYALACEIIDRALLMHDVAEAMYPNGEHKNGSAAATYIYRFLDDICPDPPKIKIKIPKGWWPFPWPPVPDPDPELHPNWTAIELVIIAAEFERSALTIQHEGLKNVFINARDMLINTADNRKR